MIFILSGGVKNRILTGNNKKTEAGRDWLEGVASPGKRDVLLATTVFANGSQTKSFVPHYLTCIEEVKQEDYEAFQSNASSSWVTEREIITPSKVMGPILLRQSKQQASTAFIQYSFKWNCFC